MLMLRWSVMFLALVAVSAVGQQSANPAPVANASGIPSNDASAPDKPMHIGGAVQKPIVIQSVPPTYSEQAKKAQFSGDVLVYLWVDKNGNPTHVRVVRSAGMGLDEKAVEAVRQYKFKPSTLDGKPITVDLYIDVNFRIFQK